ncbi:MAG: hypothetical protein Fur006_48030 [Coleofasciculaceae cyanobacterium]
MTDRVYAPNIHLFAFHLWKSFTPDGKPPQQSPELLWQTCQDILAKFEISYPLTLRTDNPSSYRVDWLKDARDNGKVFTPKLSGKTPNNSTYPQQPQLDITAIVYPLRIGDSYALTLNLRRPQKLGDDAVEIARLGDFNPNHCFLPDFIKSNLGQTLLITAFLTEAQKQQDINSLAKLADQCVQNFLGENNPTQIPYRYQSGQLFGSPIFEYGIPGESHSYGHILVWFFVSEETSIKFARDTYNQFPDLFLYRTKIIKAYQDSRQNYDDAIVKSKEIECSIGELKQRPQAQTLSEQELEILNTQIKSLLQLALEYSQLLRDMEFYRNSIKINRDNYTEKLKQIRAKLPTEDLSFLEEFSQTSAPHFQEQIQADLDYLVHASKLLEQAIATIRGIVEIDQAKRNEQQAIRENLRDRNFQTTTFAIGSGLAVGGLVISASSQVTPEKPMEMPWSSSAAFSLHPFVIWVVVSILSGLAAAIVAWWLTRLWQNYSEGA